MIKLIMSLVAGISGSVSGVLAAQEPHTLYLTLWAVALGSLSTGLIAAAHVDTPGTKAKLAKASRESQP